MWEGPAYGTGEPIVEGESQNTWVFTQGRPRTKIQAHEISGRPEMSSDRRFLIAASAVDKRPERSEIVKERGD